METDGPLKLLFRRYPGDLIGLTGDAGAVVNSAGPVELHALKRRVDCVLQLTRDGERYYRHVEFQAETDPEMASRVFRYNSQLLLEYEAPVLSTVIYLFPPGPTRPPIFSVTLGGREVNRWIFEELCLWNIDARQAIERGAPGVMALTPLMRGGTEWEVLETAARKIEAAFPDEVLSDAEDVLLALAGRDYTCSELARLVGRHRMIQSSLYTEGRVEGRAEGRLQAERELCLALATKHHPAIAERLRVKIEGCDDPARLKEWALAASDLSDGDFLKLVAS
jgi:hypothetical protein